MNKTLRPKTPDKLNRLHQANISRAFCVHSSRIERAFQEHLP
jgi:hypothetical protein